MASTALEYDDLAGVLYTAVVADALDSFGQTRRTATPGLVPITFEGVLVGRCRTTLWADMAHDDPDPYALELKAVDDLRPGDVMIAAAHGSMRSGIWGELLSTAAGNAGCRGAIVDGAVRDVTKMKQAGFPVVARGTCPLDSRNRQRVVDCDVPVELAGVVVNPGDLVVADVDGVVVVPAELEDDVLAYARNKASEENRVRDAIVGGMKATEAYRQFGVL
jgi:4-hydroxy-4-methyl-2-oxoglutarate aldolase